MNGPGGQEMHKSIELVGWLWLACCLGGCLAGWFGSTRQRLVPSPGALTEREVGGGQ